MPMLPVSALCCWLTGFVHTPAGAPVAGARITVETRPPRFATTDARGRFALRTPAGTYGIAVTAPGYAGVQIADVRIAGAALAQATRLDVTLDPLDTGAIRTVAKVTVNGRLVLSHSAIPTVVVDRTQMDALGVSRIVDALAAVPSLTFTRPDGGASSAPSVVSLRGPDPSETLIALDGQLLNDGNTGDLDLSRLPVAAFSAVDVSEGLGPGDRMTSNTIGGVVDLVSLQPTLQPHAAVSLSSGSFGRSEAWTNATGTVGRLGYALALDDQQEAGYVNQDVLLCPPGTTAATPPCPSPVPTHLGSFVAAHSVLMNLRYRFSQSADLGVRVFSLGDVRDESGAQNAPIVPAMQGPGAYFEGPGGATLAQTLRAYLLTGRMPLGAGTLHASVSASDDGVDFTGSGISPYDITHRDTRTSIGAGWDRYFDRSFFAIDGVVRHETLAATGVTGTLAQAIGAISVHGGIRPVSRLRLDAGAYWSHYSTFGSNLDGRVEASYDLSANRVLRFSAGTGFRAPLLIERYLFPLSALPPPNADNVIVGQGNPNERPEHATEYELGYAQRFGERTTLDASFYRTNLRDPIETYYPPPNPNVVQFSYPINVGNVVYQGAEIRLHRAFRDLFATVGYGLNVAYPRNLPATVANPTSGGYLVNGEQFLGIPQQVGSVELQWAHADWHAALDAYARGKNNELNQGPFAVVDAAMGRRFGALDLTLAGTNLTDAVAGRFTIPGGGVPYLGNGPTGVQQLPTDALFLEPTGIRLILTVRT